MKSRARLAALAASVVALVAGVLGVQQMLPAAAGTPTASTPVPRAAGNLIQGVVVDQSGAPVDGVEVGAFDADGERVASAETYASNWPDGKQHGYFFVEVPRGAYTIELSKKGYKTVEYDAGRITKKVKKISMGEIVIQKIAAPTKTEASLGKATITTRETGSVTVTVKGEKKTDKVLGDVEVREGRAVVGSASLGKKDRGVVTVTLEKLAKGKHTLTAYFLGNADHKASSSKVLTLTVVKKKR